MSRLVLAWRQLRADASPLLSVAAILVVTAMLAAGLPRWLGEVDDRAVVTAVQASRPGDVLGTRTRAEDLSQADVVADLALEDARIRSALEPALTDVLGPTIKTLDTPAMIVTAVDGVAVPEDFAAKTLTGRVLVTDAPVVRYVEGTEPAAGSPIPSPFPYIGDAYDKPGFQLLQSEIALSTSCADALDLPVGTTLVLAAQGSPVLARVSGVFEPIDPDSYVWRRNSGLTVPALASGAAGVTDIACTALLTGASFSTLANALVAIPPGDVLPPAASLFRHQWQMPVIASRMNARSVADLLTALDRAEAAQVGTAPDLIRISTGLQNTLETFQAQRSAAHAVIAIGTAGAIVIAIIVLALAAQLTVSRRRTAFVLARARGSSMGQILALITIEGLVAAGLAGLTGLWLASRFVRARTPNELGPRLVAVLVVSAVIALLAATLVTLRQAGAGGERESVTSTGRSPRRAAVEVGLVALAVAGVLLLRQRGLSASVVGTQVDPLLISAPVLVAVAVAVVALRAYPLPLRFLGRIAARRPGAIGFLGLARAARASAASVAPLLALLVATSFAVFGSVVQHSVRAEQEIVAWERVGAYLRVIGTDFNPDVDVPRIAAAAGVPAGSVVGIRRSQTSLIDDTGNSTGQRFDLLLLDPQAYTEFVRGTPIDATAIKTLADAPPTVESVMPAVVSPALQRLINGEGQTGQFFLPGARARLAPLAVTDQLPGFDPGGLWAVARTSDADIVTHLPYWPTILLLNAPDADPDAVTAAVHETQPFSVVVSRSTVFDALAETPLIAATSRAFGWTALVAAAYCVLTVILGLVVTAGTRARFLAYVRTVGLGNRQARSLVAMEVVPLATFAVAAGMILGLLVPRAILPAIDLRPFTGGVALPPIRIPPLAVAGLGAGLLIVVALAVLAVAAIDRRRGLGSMLRLGEDR